MTSALFLFNEGPVSVQSAEEALAPLGLTWVSLPHLRPDSAPDGGAAAPVVLVISVHQPSHALFKGVERFARQRSVPVLMVVARAALGQAEQALQAGVHLMVSHPPGAPAPWVAWLDWVQAAHRQQQQHQAALHALESKLEERKTVERAKGLLMQARQVSDEEAFRILRTLSMHANQRLGEVSQHIVQSAHLAESVNRAGQLRMLSQRLAKLHLLRLVDVAPAMVRPALSDSVRRTDEHLDWLRKRCEEAVRGPWLDPVCRAWTGLKAALDAPGTPDAWRDVDQQAEVLLDAAERLTSELEQRGGLAPLHVLNVAGRQRMLSQRYAKTALLCMLEGDADPARLLQHMNETRQHIEASLVRLHQVPLSTPDIRERLEAASQCWGQLLQAAAHPAPAGAPSLLDRLHSVAQTSEALLGLFEDLSLQYQNSLDMLVG